MNLHSRTLERFFVLVSLFLLVLMFQLLNGAYKSEFGAHPDEAAHYVTGVMVHDYLTKGFPAPPMRYAENYYRHYPRVAIGHFPPGFYVLFGSWSLVFSESRTSALVFQAVITAVLSLLVFVLIRRRFGFRWAFGGAVFFAVLPVVQTYSSRTMSDTTVALFCVAAILVFLNFMEKPSVRRSLVFGLLAALAIMVKQSGLLIAFVPPLAIILSRRFDLFRKRSLWISILPVIVICLPWLLVTLGIFREGIDDGWGLAYARAAVPWIVDKLFQALGLAVLLFAAVGNLEVIATSFMRKNNIEPYWAVVISLVFGVVALYVLVPIGSVEARYLIPAYPAVIVLAIQGITTIGKWFKSVPATRQSVISGALALLVVCVFAIERFEFPRDWFVGFRPVVDLIFAEDGTEEKKILISSDASGEGALIAEVVLADESRPRHFVFRASKMLAQSDWLGRDYKLRHKSESDLLDFLEKSEIEWVLVDKSIPVADRFAHHRLLEVAMASGQTVFKNMGEFPVDRGRGKAGYRVTVYKRIP